MRSGTYLQAGSSAFHASIAFRSASAASAASNTSRVDPIGVVPARISRTTSKAVSVGVSVASMRRIVVLHDVEGKR